MIATEWVCGTAFGLASFEGRYYIGAADHHRGESDVAEQVGACDSGGSIWVTAWCMVSGRQQLQLDNGRIGRAQV